MHKPLVITNKNSEYKYSNQSRSICFVFVPFFIFILFFSFCSSPYSRSHFVQFVSFSFSATIHLFHSQNLVSLARSNCDINLFALNWDLSIETISPFSLIFHLLCSFLVFVLWVCVCCWCALRRSPIVAAIAPMVTLPNQIVFRRRFEFFIKRFFISSFSHSAHSIQHSLSQISHLFPSAHSLR